MYRYRTIYTEITVSVCLYDKTYTSTLTERVLLNDERSNSMRRYRDFILFGFHLETEDCNKSKVQVVVFEQYDIGWLHLNKDYIDLAEFSTCS